MARRLLLSALHGRGIPVTLKIETVSDGHTASLRLIGRIQAEYLDELETHIRRHRPLLVLDLREVTLVDVASCASSLPAKRRASSCGTVRRTSVSGWAGAGPGE